MKNKWVVFTASRYMFKGRGNSPVLSLLGIATGVLALIVIISVMNGFQLGFIESILEISSYHIRLEKIPENKIDELQKIILESTGVKAVLPFKEFQALARGRRHGQQGLQAVLVRGLGENAVNEDPGLKEKLIFEEGSFDIKDHGSVLLGTELARRLGYGTGDSVTMFSISGILSAEDEGGIDTFTIKGIFRTGYYEYDYSWAFVNIENNTFFTGETSDLALGVKIYNRFQDRQVMDQLKRKITAAGGFDGVVFSSWRDYNRSFFGALRTEKLFMFILVGLIFIVVSLNIFQSQRRAVLQRREEIALLRAVGGNELSVRMVFLLDGAFIGLTGSLIGLCLGLSIALNIPQFFSLLEKIVNTIINLINIIAGFLGTGFTRNFSFFSPAIFYIKEIPSRILPADIIIIFMFGFLSASLAAWFASGKAAKIKPAEVLRYE